MAKKNCVIGCCQALMLAIEEASLNPATMTYSKVMELAEHYTRNYSQETRDKACAVINVGTICSMVHEITEESIAINAFGRHRTR